MKLFFFLRMRLLTALGLCWLLIGWLLIGVGLVGYVYGTQFERSFLGIPGEALFGVAGLVTSLVAVRMLLYPFRCLQDVISSLVTISGKVERRRLAQPTNLMSDGFSYYITVGAREFEISELDCGQVVEGQEVTLTYWPNTRAIRSLAPVYPTWATQTVLAIAHGILEERAFERLPILADALEEAGYTDAEILRRCRETRDHDECRRLIDTILQPKRADDN